MRNMNVRLSNTEIAAIKETVLKADKEAKIFLFGSRADESRKGGDIDLLIMSDKLKPQDIRKIRLKLYDRLEEQKIDIVLASDTTQPFVRIALTEGVAL